MFRLLEETRQQHETKLKDDMQNKEKQIDELTLQTNQLQKQVEIEV